MDDAALRLLDSLRDPAGVYPSPAALEAFARLLAGASDTRTARRWAATAIEEGPRIRARAEAFRMVYKAAEGHAHRIDLTASTSQHRGALALEGILALPVRERAVLALSCVLGFTIGEVAHVIGCEPAVAHSELDEAVAQLQRRSAGRSAGHVA